MKKISNIIFSLFVFTVIVCVSCNLKKTNESIPENPKTSPRIRELDWYVGKWEEFVKEEDGCFEENTKIPVELEISKNNNKYYIVLNEKGKKTEGELYIDKIFLPKTLTEEERIKYDASDYVVADFSTFRYWIGIQYTAESDDTISLNVDDTDICVCKRVAKRNGINSINK